MTSLVWALSGPIMVMPSYTDMPIPQEVRNRITIERMIAVAADKELASEAEAMWYISTASLTAPLGTHWSNIFMYLTRKHMQAISQELPGFLQDEITLDPYMEAAPLQRLREWLFKRSYEAVKIKMR